MTIKLANNLYDETKGYDEEVHIEKLLNPNLTEGQIEEAIKFYKFFNGLQGLCIAVGMPGAGKDIFGNYLSWKLKQYFPSKKVWRDEKPRELYGRYNGLFNEEFLIKDLSRMKSLATSGVTKEIKKGSKQLAAAEKSLGKWTSEIGEVMLKDSFLVLTEFWRYFHNRRPHNPMGITLGGILKNKRHLDCLIIGSGQLRRELDRFSCIPYMNWEVECIPSERLLMPDGKPRGFIFAIWRTKFTGFGNGLIRIPPPLILRVDAGKERDDLGGKRIFDLFNSQSAPQITPAIKFEDD